MKKGIIIGLVVLLIAGLGYGAYYIGLLSPGSVKGKEMELSFAFGKRDGVYSGNVSKQLKHRGQPHGNGKFETTATNGTKYYLDGDWINGSFTGEGTTMYENGDFYEGEFKNGYPHGIVKYNVVSPDFKDPFIYIGEFVKDKPKNELAYTVAYVLYNASEGSLSNTSDYDYHEYTASHPTYFPALTAEAKKNVKTQAAPANYKAMDKNLSKFTKTLISFKCQIMQIWEDDGQTMLVVCDKDGNVYQTFYPAETSFLKGDIVQIIGLPLADSSYSNTGGGTTLFIAVLAATISK